MQFKNSKITYAAHSYIDFISDAGTASVNASVAELIFRHTDMEMGEGTFKMGLSHIYNNYCHIVDTGVGNNWKLNIQQYIKPYDSSMRLEGFNVGDYLYLDGDGYIHRFVKYDGNRYLDTLGNGMTLVTSYNSYQIQDAQNNVYDFNSAGNLIKLSIEGNPNTIIKHIELDNLGRPIKFYDSRSIGKRERYFRFEYKNSLLYKISLISLGKELESIYYSYIGTNLKSNYYFINNALSQVALFKYDSSDNLIFATATPNGLALKFTTYASKIIVEKGISKLYLSSFAALNDGLYSGETIPIPSVEPEIGFKNVRKAKGNFIVETSNDGLYHLGEISAFETLQDETVILESYDSFGVSDSSIIEKTTFNHYSSYSSIKSDKDIEYRYYHNKKGFVTGVFEVEGNHLRTLTKDNGISIMYEMPKDYYQETINNKSIVTATIGKSIKCLDKDNRDCGFFTGGRTLKAYRDKDGLNYINFVASFWINVSCTNASYMKVFFEIFHMNWIKKEIFIDKTANNAWQYVTLSFSIRDDDQSKTYDFDSAYIKVLTDGTGTYQVSDFRIKEGEMSKLKISNFNASQPSISEFYSVRLQLTNGRSQTILLDHENFLTDSDILFAYKNRMIRGESGFDFVYCGNTKRIANVSKVYFRVYENMDYTGMKNEYEIYSDSGIKFITHSSDNSCVTSKYFYFYDKKLEEYNEVSINKSYFGGKNSTVSDYQGRILQTVDAYKKKTVNEYDLYGNLISTTTALEDDFGSDNKVKSGKKRFYTRYIYDDESENGKYREMVIDTKVQNSSVKIRKNSQMLNTVDSVQVGNNYTQNFSYDLLNRVKEQSINFDFNKKVYHHFEYDSLGRIKAITDNEKYRFGFDYDIYGNIKKYYIEKNKEILDVKSKSVTPNGSSFGGDLQEEINHLTNCKITTEKDKYGRPRKIFFSDIFFKKVEFEYQEQDAHINSNSYSTPLAESQSIAKIKHINDSLDGTQTTFWYDNNNDACGYKIEKNDKEILRIQQLDSQNTKYVIGNKHYKTSVEKNNIYTAPQIIKTSVYDDQKDDGKDEWKEVKKFGFSYEYDNILGVVKKKNNSDSSLEYNFIPKDNTVFYSNLVQNSTHKIKDCTYQFDYSYDENENIRRIHSTKNGDTDISYSYDKLNRLKTEYNTRQGIDNTYSYLDNNSQDINRVTKVFQGTTKVKEYEYDELNRLTKYYRNGSLIKELQYHENNLLPHHIIKNGNSYKLGWERGNLLSFYLNTFFTYNYQGNRVTKDNSGGIKVKYYYDGSKLLGEDYSNGIKLRYMYDLMGIAGVRYIASDGSIIDYDYAKDGQGNIVAVIKDGVIITEYFYDAWGNTKVNILNNSDPFATLNPIRWRGHYYDSETEMYFINGRYYDPNLCSYIDSMEIETVLDSSNTIGALNLNAICTDNPTDLGSNNFTVLTNTDLMPDPVYDPLAGYSWWDRNWKSVIRYGLFTLTFAVSIILMCIPGTQAFGIGMFNAGLGAAISGAIVGGLIGGIISAIQGNGFFKGFADSAITGFVDGFTAGAILYCVSSAVSAISKSIKASNQVCAKPAQCFVAGTLVMTAEGYKKIEDIELDDKVWSWCEETGEKILNRVTNLFRNQTHDLVHLSIAGEELTTTLGHPFYVVDYGWKKASELVEKDKVVLYNNAIVEVDNISIEHTEELVDVYNFEVENAHTYYVTTRGVLVHNVCATSAANKIDDLQFENVKQLNEHFAKHGKEFGDLVKNVDDYNQLANYVVKHGEYISEMNGYIRFFGSNGKANYAFVGLKNGGKNIATFGIRHVANLAKQTAKFII